MDADLREAFDQEFYRRQIPDAEFPDDDPLRHYLDSGWRKGLDPAPWFSSQAYLAAYADVRQAGINPLVHYLRYGRCEGRIAGVRPPPCAVPAGRETSAADLAEVPEAAAATTAANAATHARIAAVIAPHFNAGFYLAVNPDVSGSGADPVLHYVVKGWTEGRDPAPEFSTSYYLEANPDVQAEGLNPFWHYIVTGRDENRLPREPGGHRAHVLKTLAPLEETVRIWRSAPRETTAADLCELTDGLKRALRRGTGRLILSFAHDDYRNNVGGVQLCILREEQAALAAGHCYISLSPAQPLPRLALPEEAGDLTVNLTLNGAAMGSAPFDRIVAALSRTRGPAAALSLVVHSLMGHAPEAVAAAARALKPDDAWFWLHDNFSMCSSYGLLRNTITFCGAPALGSQACGICLHGEERASHVPRMRALFEAVPFTVVAPSEAELRLWTDRSGLPSKRSKVLPHLRLDWTGAWRRNGARFEGPVRVAFVGIASTVKGWPVFRHLAESLAGAEGYEFLYFGVDDPGTPAISACPVAVTPERRTAMRDALIEAGADLVVHWSACPETFSFSAYEALAAGAALLTHPGTGNVAALVRESGRGKVLEDENRLRDFFAGGEARALARGNRLTAECGAGFVLSRMTIDLIEGKQTDGGALLHELHV